MLEYARWKYVVALIVLLVSALYTVPNLYPQDPAIQITASRGGKVDQNLQDSVAKSLDEAGLAYKSIEIEDDKLLVRVADAGLQQKANDLLRPQLNRYTVALNLASNVPEWLSWFNAEPMLLGLDLLGGVHFLLQVDEQSALEKRVSAYNEEIRELLREKKIAFKEITTQGNAVNVVLGKSEQLSQALSELSLIAPELSVVSRSGDDAGFTASVPAALIKEIIDSTIQQNVGILRKRINAIGVGEPVIARQGLNRIVVQLPGVQDTAQAKRVLGSQATLEYRAVVGTAVEARVAQQSGIVPPDARLYFERQTDSAGNKLPVLLSKRLIASGEQLVDARSGTDPQSASPMVSVKLNAAAGQRMFDFTSKNVGNNMAVVFIERTPETRLVNGVEQRSFRVVEEVISNAVIQGVFSKSFQTTGLDSAQEAQDLALILRAGALAAPMDIIQERVIGPSLGAENISRGVQAVFWSFLFVLAFFLVYYRVFGLITNIALAMNLLMLVAIMSILGATLTLPGLAGIALTVGLSVDANVLINERIREELRLGNTPLNSIATGYEKASGTIFDANITAILAGVALFAFGTGPVQGFAVTLILGILTSMYTAVSVSRAVATLMHSGRKLKTLWI